MATMFDEYYKLKEAYETSLRNQRLELLKKKKKGKRLKKLKTKCVKCSREGGTLFSSAFSEKVLSRVLTARCGVVTNPCDLNIEIQTGSHELIQDILKYDEKELESVKQQIIINKNNLLFGYMKTEETIGSFEELKKQVNDHTGSIEYYSKIYYDKFDNKKEKEQLNKHIADSYDSIHKIKEFLNGEEYEDQHIVSAVKVYTEQLKPQLDQIMHLKYKQNMVWYDEDTNTYHLIQSNQTIGSLEVSLVEAKVMTRVKSKPLENKEEEFGEYSIGEEIEDDSYESLD